MTWTTELPTKLGWYYRRAVSASFAGLDAEIEIVSIFISGWGHEPDHLCVARLWEDDVPLNRDVIGRMGDKYQYEFQPVKPPEESLKS